MTVYAQVVTNDGKNNLLYTGFAGGVGASPFGFMAAGKSTTDPTEGSDGLVAECSSEDGDYSRTILTNQINTDLNKITMEGIFPITNITNTTEINEVGIVDRDTLLQGTFFCICRIPAMTKNGDNQLRIVITATLESV
jgi:hypothetical protein